MKKFYLLLCIFLFSLGFAQSVQLYNPADNTPYPAEQYFCEGERFNLKVDAVASSTGDYALSSFDPNTIEFSAGTNEVIFASSGSDKFSKAFPIGFDFSFYGKTYSKVVMGSNGRLVFTNDSELENLNNNGVYTDRTFSGVSGYNTYSKLPSTDYNKIYKNNPAQELNLAQIFFGYTDLVPKSSNSSVNYRYKNIVLNGVKGLMVSFQNQIRTNGMGAISSSRYDSFVLLMEDGRVMIYVKNKTEAGYNAILGIQNENATKHKVPAHSTSGYDYNNGPWKSEGKAWLFTPNQNLSPVFKWTRNGAEITGEASDTLLNFTPNDNDVLKVEVSYIDPDTGTPVGSSVSDQVLFKSLKTPVIRTTSSTCAQINLETDLIPNVSYEWVKVGDATILSTTNKLSVTASGEYIVKVIRNVSGGGCIMESAPVSLTLNGNFPPFDNSPKFICKTEGSAQTTVNLYDYYPANTAQYTLKFQENGADIASPENFVIDADQTRNIKIVAESVNTTAPCSFTDNFDITFISLPTADSQYSPANLCFGNDSYPLSNFENQYFAGKNYQFSYSLDGGGTYQNLSVVNPQTVNPVFVKIKHPNAECETVVKLKFNFNPKVTANTPITQLPPQCASATQTFDLASLIPEINPDPNVTVTFHNSLQDAANGTSPVSYNFRSGMGYTTLYIRVVDNATGCVSPDHPEITLLVYQKPGLLVNNIAKANCAGNTLFDLTQDISALTDAAEPVTVTLEYYSSGGTLLNDAEISNYNADTYGLNPYIKVIYNTTCSDRVNFSLSYNPKPVATNTTPILICTETSYAVDTFKSRVVSNPENYTFTDLSGAPLPDNFDVTSLPLTVDFLMKDNATGCISDQQTVTFVRGGISDLDTVETDFTLCDTDFDGQITFNLDTKKGDFTSDPSAIFEYFKDAAYTQPIFSSYTNETPFAQTVYVRITLTGFCPADAKINLKVNTPSKSSTLRDTYFICYGETVVIDAGNENEDWKWSTGETTQSISLNKAGAYSVILTNSEGCSYTHNFTVSDENQPKIKVINQTNNSIEVIANGGLQPYTYYFNGIAQPSNILQNPTEESYEIQVESARGCFGPPQTVYFIKINNAFTPNGDGINDYWTVSHLDKMQEVSVIITDRYGKKVFEAVNPKNVSWDGTHYGRELPTSSYWYTISWFDPVTQKQEQRQGWILLKNRN